MLWNIENMVKKNSGIYSGNTKTGVFIIPLFNN
jgi:hypothetical protein